MSTASKNQLMIKIFVGFPASVDLMMKLNQKSKWKEAFILKDSDKKHLSVVRYNEQEYVGKYLDQDMLMLKDVKKTSDEIKEQLHLYLPEYDVDNLNITLFPQAFVP